MFDRRFSLLGDLSPTPDQVNAFRDYTRLARSEASAGDQDGARAAWQAANEIFIAMGSPAAYKDELDYAGAAALGTNVGGSVAGSSNNVIADILSGNSLTTQALVNSRPTSVSNSFFTSFSASVDSALSGLGSISPYVKIGGGLVIGGLIVKLLLSIFRGGR
jgi:hypothetical protein